MALSAVGFVLTPVGALLAMPVTLPILGIMPVKELLISWVPLAYVLFMPLFCCLFALVGCCGNGDGRDIKFGTRTAMRRVMIAVRAETRMGIQTKYTRMLAAGFKKGGPSYAKPTASAVESGLISRGAKGSPPSAGKKMQAKSKATPKK